VALSDLAPGDLLFWAVDVTNPATIHHVAMYVGAGRMIEAPRTGLTVRETAVPLDGLIGAVRPGA
jgi:cell wall-associated NlpC family hydrolase